ncbi:hypothetical protein FQZ97_1058220 [compost metagenome]
MDGAAQVGRQFTGNPVDALAIPDHLTRLHFHVALQLANHLMHAAFAVERVTVDGLAEGLAIPPNQ